MVAEAPPTGTLTMLFSDIEGSTALLTRLGPDQYGEVLSAHRRIVRAAVASVGGRDMGTEGDSFFVVFGSAIDAVAAAVATQREMAGHRWPAGVIPRVRMGLHTGEPEVHEHAYVGLDIHRAARVAGAAHGGQVLLTAATGRWPGPRSPRASPRRTSASTGSRTWPCRSACTASSSPACRSSRRPPRASAPAPVSLSRTPPSSDVSPSSPCSPASSPGVAGSSRCSGSVVSARPDWRWRRRRSPPQASPTECISLRSPRSPTSRLRGPGWRRRCRATPARTRPSSRGRR